MKGEPDADLLWAAEEGEAEFSAGVVPFGNKAITDFKDAVDILFRMDLGNHRMQNLSSTPFRRS